MMYKCAFCEKKCGDVFCSKECRDKYCELKSDGKYWKDKVTNSNI